MTTLNTLVTKLQFKLNHMSVAHRAAVLGGGLFLIFVPWYFLIYGPQTEISAQIEDQIITLNNKAADFQRRYDKILQLVQSNDTGRLLVRYQALQKKMKVLDQQIDQFHHRYISDKNLATLLHAILEKVEHVTIQNFTTTLKNPVVPIKDAPTADKDKKKEPPKPPNPEEPTPADLATGLSYYTLTLKGDYFSILNFLKQIEQLKWQIFWTKINYQVQQYPEGLATIEFYTLRPALMLINPPISGGTQ